MASKKKSTSTALAWEHVDAMFPEMTEAGNFSAFFHPEEERFWLVVAREFEGLGVWRLGDRDFELVTDGRRLGLNQHDRYAERLLGVHAYWDPERAAPVIAATRGTEGEFWAGHILGEALVPFASEPPKISLDVYAGHIFTFDSKRRVLVCIAADLSLWELGARGWNRLTALPYEGTSREVVAGFDERSGRTVVVHLASQTTLAWDGATFAPLGSTPRSVSLGSGAEVVHKRQRIATWSDPKKNRFLLYLPSDASSRLPIDGGEIWALSPDGWSVVTPPDTPGAVAAFCFEPKREQVCALLPAEPRGSRLFRRQAWLDNAFVYEGLVMGRPHSMVIAGRDVVAVGWSGQAVGWSWQARWTGEAFEALDLDGVFEPAFGAWGRHGDRVVALGVDGHVYAVEDRRVVRVSAAAGTPPSPRYPLRSAYDPSGRTLFVQGPEVYTWDGHALTRSLVKNRAPEWHRNAIAWHPGLGVLVATNIEANEVWTLDKGVWQGHPCVFGKKKWSKNPHAKLLAWDDASQRMFLVLGMVWDSKFPEWAILVMDSVSSFRTIAMLRHNHVDRSIGLGAAAVELAYDPIRRELLAVGSPHDGACSFAVMRLGLGHLLDTVGGG